MYDMVAAKLAAQGADQSALVGRAKDLLGVASITTTITGVLANDKITKFDKGPVHPLIVVVMGVAILTVIACAFASMRPRVWYLSPEPNDVAATISEEPAWPVDAYYASVATGFLNADVVVDGKSALEHNKDQIATLRLAVRVQIISLGALVLSGILLSADITH